MNRTDKVKNIEKIAGRATEVDKQLEVQWTSGLFNDLAQALETNQDRQASDTLWRLAADYLLGGGAAHSECVIVASSYMQAKIIFRYAVRMVREEGHDPDDRAAWYHRDGRAWGCSGRGTAATVSAAGRPIPAASRFCPPNARFRQRPGLAAPGRERTPFREQERLR